MTIPAIAPPDKPFFFGAGVGEGPGGLVGVFGPGGVGAGGVGGVGAGGVGEGGVGAGGEGVGEGVGAGGEGVGEGGADIHLIFRRAVFVVEFDFHWLVPRGNGRRPTTW